MTTYQQLRIGDADRDAAAAALSEHYAAGRLTKPEYDERLESIWAATYQSDLRPIFADLPRATGPGQAGGVAATGPWPGGGGRRMMMRGPAGRLPDLGRFFWKVPLLLFGLLAVAIIALHMVPFLAIIALFFFLCGGFRSRRHHHYHHA